MVSIIVSTDIEGEYVDVGDLVFTPLPNEGHLSRFRYDTDFVRRGYPIDPALRLDSAPHAVIEDSRSRLKTRVPTRGEGFCSNEPNAQRPRSRGATRAGSRQTRCCWSPAT